MKQRYYGSHWHKILVYATTDAIYTFLHHSIDCQNWCESSQLGNHINPCVMLPLFVPWFIIFFVRLYALVWVESRTKTSTINNTNISDQGKKPTQTAKQLSYVRRMQPVKSICNSPTKISKSQKTYKGFKKVHSSFYGTILKIKNYGKILIN